MTALSAVGLNSGYGPTEIVHDVHMQISEGEIVCVLGRNGVGKTTLLKSILGLLKPARGEVTILGHRVDSWPTHRIVRLGVGYGPQELAIFRQLTVAENFALGRGAGDGSRRNLDAVLNALPALRARMHQHAGSLSGGEQKMLVFARALLGAPPLVILDEVVEGVQPLLVDRFREIGRQRNQERGTAFLIVEQNIGFALSLASRFIVMKAGRIVEEGTATDETMASIEQHLLL